MPPVCGCPAAAVSHTLTGLLVLLGTVTCCCCRRSPPELCSIPASRAGPRALLAHSRCCLGPDRTRPSVSPGTMSTRAHQLWHRLCKGTALQADSLHIVQLVQWCSLAVCIQNCGVHRTTVLKAGLLRYRSFLQTCWLSLQVQRIDFCALPTGEAALVWALALLGLLPGRLQQQRCTFYSKPCVAGARLPLRQAAVMC